MGVKVLALTGCGCNTSGATSATGETRMARPKLPDGEGKRHALNLRTTLDLRSKLDAAAQTSGRSLAQEVEWRLEQSFGPRNPSVEEVFGGPDRALLARVVAHAVGIVEIVSGKTWREDAETRAKAYQTIKSLLLATLGDGVHPLETDTAVLDGWVIASDIENRIRANPEVMSLFPVFSAIGESEEARQARLARMSKQGLGLLAQHSKGQELRDLKKASDIPKSHKKSRQSKAIDPSATSEN